MSVIERLSARGRVRYGRLHCTPLLIPSNTLHSLRRKIEVRANDTLVSCNICENSDTLQNVYKYLGSALGELCSKQYNNPNWKRKPSHQKSFTQPPFYATRKKRKIDSKSLSKPSTVEALLSQEAVHDTETEICGICFKEDKDCNSEINWVSCSSCWMWVHTQCADVPSNFLPDHEYVCQYCNTHTSNT